MNEIETIKNIQNGDMEAFENLFEIYKSQALRTVYLITGNIYTSEDIVQESFIKCFYSIKSLKTPEHFKSWFFKILTRTAWRYSNKDKKAIPVENIYEKADTESIDKSINIYLSKEENEILHEEIDKLELKQKTVIILYYFNGLTVKEISKIVGCFEGTVKSRLHCARNNLKKRLNEAEKKSISPIRESEKSEVCRSN